MLLNNIRLILKIFDKITNQLICVINDFNILTNNPYDWSFGLRVIEVVEVLANINKESLIFVRIFTKDISYYDYCLLNNISNFCLKCLPQALDTFISHFFKLNRAFSHCIDCFADKLNIYFVNILFELMQNHQYIFIISNFR